MQFGNPAQFLVSSATEFLYMAGLDDVRCQYRVLLGFSQGYPNPLLRNILPPSSRLARKYAIIIYCTFMYNLGRSIAHCYTARVKFKTLQENLRKTLRERIDGGALTGLGLARQTGFKQAHISNFLNRKRSLSLEGMDRVLQVQHLSVLDLLDPAEVNRRATVPPPGDDEFDNILVVDAAAATQPLIMSMNVREIQKFQRTFLRRLRPDMDGNRRNWERFVAIKPARDAMSMHPRLEPGALV